MSMLRVNQINPFSSLGIAVGGAPSHVSAVWDFKTTTQGILFPRLTTAQRDAIVLPQDGLTIYNIDTHAIEHWNSLSMAWESSDGVQSINGQKNKHQILNNGFAGFAPNWTQAGDNINTLNIPLASTPSVTAGLISKADYDTFNARLYPVKNVRYVVTNLVLGPQDFSSIQDAIDSITDASASNPYLVIVGPGVYVEDTIVMKSWVWVVGAEQDQTVIEVNAPNKHVVIGADSSGVSKVLLRGATDPGFAAVYYQSLTGTTNTSFFVEDVRFGNNDTLGIADGSVAPTAIFLENCKFGSTYQFNHGFLGQTGGRIVARNCTTTGLTAPFPDYVFKGAGAGSQIVINGAQIRSGSITSGACIHLTDGAFLRALSVNVHAFGKALWVENAGAASVVDAVGFLCENNTMDIVVEHPGCDGTFNGSADHTKVYVDPSSTFSPVFSCNRMPSDNTGFVTVGSILQGDRYDRLLNLSLLTREDITLGAVSGGALSDAGGFTLSVTGGSGFLIDPTLLFVKEVSWSSGTLTIPPNATRYIFIDANGIVQQAPAPQSLTTTIPLGKVTTNGTEIRFVESTDMSMPHVGNKIEEYLRALGPVFGTGGVVSENGVRQLDVTPGLYYYGVNSLSLSGGAPVSWISLYRDGSGGWIEGSQNVVSNTQYDDGTGTLATIPLLQYAAHTLYAVGDSGNETYFLVYSQATYATQALAEAAALPLTPSYISDAVVRIASVIVQNGANNIVKIIDIRPRIGFAANATAGTTDHGNLLGLLDDDHPQYLLINGSRPMTGPLDMGSQNIVNVNLVDGVDVSAHASRHLPNGADAIPTAAPLVSLSATTTNAAGTSNSISRSDHEHAILTGAAISQIPDQVNAVGTSANLARADHIHNIPTAAPLVSLSATTTNSQGVEASFSRSDHSHAILTSAPSAILAGGTGATGVSSNLSRADHVHAAPTAAPTTTLTGDTANADGSANTFSRSDHVHAILTGTPISQTPDQANSSGSSASLVRADHTHNVPTAAAVGLDANSANTQGAAATFARSDHTHAISSGTAISQVPDQANAVGTSADFARADHVHNIPTAAAVGLTADSINAQGVAATFSRSDHTHDLATGVVVSQVPDQANSEGVSANLARADHVHNIPAEAPVDVGAVNSEGVAASFSRSDHVHNVFPVFAFQHVHTAATITNGGGTLVVAQTLATAVLPAGEYRIGWYTEYKQTVNTADWQGAIRVDGVAVSNINDEIVDINSWRSWGGFHYVTLPVSAAITIEIMFATEGGTGTASARNRRLEIHRVG